MSVRHTPGPWHVIENGPIIRIHYSMPDGRESGSAVSIGSTALQFRASRQGSHRGEKMVYRPFAEHDRADARLIAAAPELLDALRAFCGDYESTPTTSDTSLKAAYLHALTVIAKVEGREG